MPYRQTPILPENIYHIYNRGVNKEKIFFSDRNYCFFIERMNKYLKPCSEIIGYCLMPNHFHLLLQVNNLLDFKRSIQLFLMSYSKAVNNEQHRIGPLFQGRYQANLIEEDAYLLECLHYIHLNPVTAGLVRNPELWPYSSYRDYLHPNPGSFLNTSLIMGFFDSIIEFKEFTESGIDNSK